MSRGPKGVAERGRERAQRLREQAKRVAERKDPEHWSWLLGTASLIEELLNQLDAAELADKREQQLRETGR